MERFRDTSPEAEAVYWRRLSEMTPGETLRIGTGLWEMAHHVQRSVMRRDFPDADERQILRRMAETRFGRDIADRAYGRK